VFIKLTVVEFVKGVLSIDHDATEAQG